MRLFVHLAPPGAEKNALAFFESLRDKMYT